MNPSLQEFFWRHHGDAMRAFGYQRWTSRTVPMRRHSRDLGEGLPTGPVGRPEATGRRDGGGGGN